VIVGTAWVALLFNIVAFVGWTSITEIWYGYDCEANYISTEVEICPDPGLLYAVISIGACLVSTVIYSGAMSAMDASSYYSKLDETKGADVSESVV
jgi:hypothetical protein